MTEKIYLGDSYLKELEAQITSIENNTVVFDKTIFYPTGGGQPTDTGNVYINGKEYKVLEAKKSDNDIIHVLDRNPDAKVGDLVKMKIDWERRYAHMRYHTAVHIIDGIVSKKYNGELTGGQIYEDSAHDDFDIPNFSKELMESVIADAQKIVEENRRVVARILSKEEAEKVTNLARTEPGRVLLSKLTEFRVIDIEGFDMQLDGGTHVATTKEVGKIVLSKIENKGTHRKRVEIKLEPTTS
ncbi:MAG: alanine--tRNA ligase-related protein [Candidatus Micrarchaeia archaeon]